MTARIASLFVASTLGLAILLGGLVGALRAGEEPKKEPAKDTPTETQKDDAFELVIPGQILKNDPVDKSQGVPAKVYAVRLLKGKSYVFDLVSADFDSYLRLEDAAGNQVAADDDGGGMLNSRIRFTASKDDVYLIFATSLGGGDGDYTLSVKSFVAAPVKLVAMPAFAKKVSEVQGNLAVNDPLANTRAHPCKTFSIELKATKTYTIDMTAAFDTYLLLEDANGILIEQNDDNGENLNSRIQFQPAADGRFRLVATTYNGEVGAFTLRVAED